MRARPRADRRSIGWPFDGPPPSAEAVLWMAARDKSGYVKLRGVEHLALSASAEVDRAVEEALAGCVARAWAGGWQPKELLRQGRIAANATVGRLVAVVIAADHLGRKPGDLDHRWREQLEELDLPAVSGPGWFGSWGADERLLRLDLLGAAVEALRAIGLIHGLDVLLPPPGSHGSGPTQIPTALHGPRAGESNPMLEKIRALLAKAESTEFEAEALAFTAKAQELMTRHAVDAATVAVGGAGAGERPVMVRVPIDAPYVDAKSLLLQVVAEAGRCRAVFHPEVALSSVVGFADDVTWVEVLFTSLLVQAQSALGAVTKAAPAGTRARSQGFRSAFLVGFAHRIADRLGEINTAVIEEVSAEGDGAFLPVLASRQEAVDELLAERFGRLGQSRVRGGYDAAGWASGQSAAQSARLAAGDLVERNAARR